MRLALSVLALVVAFGPALAAEIYLFDLLRRPTYRHAYDRMLASGGQIPAWVVKFGRDFDGAADPAVDLKVGNRKYTLAEVCKPHDCPGNRLRVIVDDDLSPSVAWAQLENEGRVRWLGNPPADVRSAVERFDH